MKSRFWGNDPPTVQIRRVAGLAPNDNWCDAIVKAFAEASSIPRRTLFGERFNYTASAGMTCIWRLFPGRKCNHTGIRQCWPPGTDHASLWLLGGKPIAFVSQPYEWNDGTAQGAAAFAREHGLRFIIRADWSWHYPGSSFLVLWWNPDAPAWEAKG